MGRLVMFVVAIGIVGYLGYRAMYGRAPVAGQGVSAPKQKLDNVNGAARRIEAQQQQAAENALEKSKGE